MKRISYVFRPLEHVLDASAPDLNVMHQFAVYPPLNVRLRRRSIQKRWGYSTTYRDLGAGKEVQAVGIYQLKNGTRNTMYLTNTDLCFKETASGKTWSYKTDTYTTGTVTDITGTTVTGNSTLWNTNAAAGDFFIMDSDHTTNVEHDSDWVEIASITDDTHLELVSNYTKNGTGYKIRKVYTTPDNEVWFWVTIDDKFIFGNGNTNVQYWDGSNYATDLDSTTAIKARYGIEFANRLVIADFGTTRDPVGIAWSKEGDPTDLTTDNTAGEAQLLDTTGYITGLGKSYSTIIVYKRESIVFGHRSGDAFFPLLFPRFQEGVGCIAPRSIVPFVSFNAFLGRDDFYMIEGENITSIGEKVREKFFEITEQTEAENTRGFLNEDETQILWFVDTSDGRVVFGWDYKRREWTVDKFADTITTLGTGAL